MYPVDLKRSPTPSCRFPVADHRPRDRRHFCKKIVWSIRNPVSIGVRILINDENQVLVSDEYIRGNYYTKFPGGGLEFGEGTRDCLAREFMEEMNLKVEVVIISTQPIISRCPPSTPEHQIISIYYTPMPWSLSVPPATAFDFDEPSWPSTRKNGKSKTFRFIDGHAYSEESNASDRQDCFQKSSGKILVIADRGLLRLSAAWLRAQVAFQSSHAPDRSPASAEGHAEFVVDVVPDADTHHQSRAPGRTLVGGNPRSDIKGDKQHHKAVHKLQTTVEPGERSQIQRSPVSFLIHGNIRPAIAQPKYQRAMMIQELWPKDGPVGLSASGTPCFCIIGDPETRRCQVNRTLEHQEGIGDRGQWTSAKKAHPL